MQKLTHARGVSGVYVIVHVESGLAYIGSSCDIAQRWFKHRGTLRRGIHSNPRMQAAWSEYGEDAFRFVIVERVLVSDLRVRELWWLEQGETWLPERGYNLSKRSDTVGHQFTPEQSARVSTALKGKKKSPEHCAAMSAAMLALSPEEKEIRRERMAAIGRSGKGKRKKVAHLRKIGTAQRGGKNHAAKLTDAQVVEIMWRLANGEKGRYLGIEYRVTESVISAIKHGHIWKHLTNVQR